MHGDDIRTGFGKTFHLRIRMIHHQMHIDGLIGIGSNGGANIVANGNRGNKRAIHDIEVNPVAATLVDGTNLFSQPGKIR